MNEEYRGYGIAIFWNHEGCGWMFTARKPVENEEDIVIEDGLVYFYEEEAVAACTKAIDIYEDGNEEDGADGNEEDSE